MLLTVNDFLCSFYNTLWKEWHQKFVIPDFLQSSGHDNAKCQSINFENPYSYQNLCKGSYKVEIQAHMFLMFSLNYMQKVNKLKKDTFQNYYGKFQQKFFQKFCRNRNYGGILLSCSNGFYRTLIPKWKYILYQGTYEYK